MKKLTTTALIALMTATAGLAAVAPSYAQSAPAPIERPNAQPRHEGHGPRGPMGGRDLLSLDRGSEAVEIALVRLSHRIDLTAEQQTLLDTLKTDALAAADKLEGTIEGLRPTPPVEGAAPTAPDFATRLQNRIDLDTARLEALKSVQPAATAFFASLTDEQKADLMPQRPDQGGRPGHFGQHNAGKGGQGQHGAGLGAKPNAPEAPATNG